MAAEPDEDDACPDSVDATVGPRVFLRDVKPFAVVERLDRLRGPDGGAVALRHSVLWAPGSGEVDLDEPGGTAVAYQATLAEGSVADLERILNAQRLVRVWSQLVLPARLRGRRESRFPSLAAAGVDSTPTDRS